MCARTILCLLIVPVVAASAVSGSSSDQITMLNQVCSSGDEAFPRSTEKARPVSLACQISDGDSPLTGSEISDPGFKLATPRLGYLPRLGAIANKRWSSLFELSGGGARAVASD